MRFERRVDIAKLKLDRLVEIDAEAEAMRAHFITPGSGQAMVYAEKRREAEELLANPEVSLATLPHLAAEAELNGITPFEQAVEYLTMAQQWLVVSPLIEGIRLAAKTAVNSAETPTAVRGVNADWTPVQSLISL